MLGVVDPVPQMHEHDRDITPSSPHPILRSAKDREGIAIDAAEGAEHAMRLLAHELTGLIDSSLRCVTRARATSDNPERSDRVTLDTMNAYLATAEASLLEAASMVQTTLRTGSLAGQPSGRSLSPRRAPAEILVHAAEVLLPLAEQTGVRLTTTIAPGARDLPPLPIYPIIANALRNAVEACPPSGSVTARLSVDADAPAHKPLLLLEIENDGPPPPTDFDPFEMGVSTKEHGSGFGLAIARDVAHSMAGTVTLEPRHDATGAVFTLRVPLTKRVIG